MKSFTSNKSKEIFFKIVHKTKDRIEAQDWFTGEKVELLLRNFKKGKQNQKIWADLQEQGYSLVYVTQGGFNFASFYELQQKFKQTIQITSLIHQKIPFLVNLLTEESLGSLKNIKCLKDFEHFLMNSSEEIRKVFETVDVEKDYEIKFQLKSYSNHSLKPLMEFIQLMKRENLEVHYDGNCNYKILRIHEKKNHAAIKQIIRTYWCAVGKTYWTFK